MAFGERKKMGDKYRLALTATVLNYIDTARQLKQDPMGLASLPTTGTVLLGAEIGKSSPDSVWWITLNPNTGGMSGSKQLHYDLSKWRKQLNTQLKTWGQKSAVKMLRNKRARNAGIVAAVVVAVAAATVLTLGAAGVIGAGAGAGAGAAGAGAATTAVATTATTTTAAAGGGTALGTAAGGGAGALIPTLQAITQAASSGLEAQAQAAQEQLPPSLAAAAEEDAGSTQTHSLEGSMGIALIVAAGVGVVGIGLLLKGMKVARDES